jgi:hypothetical protein
VAAFFGAHMEGQDCSTQSPVGQRHRDNPSGYHTIFADILDFHSSVEKIVPDIDKSKPLF